MATRLKPNIAVIGGIALEQELKKSKGLSGTHAHYYTSIPSALKAHREKSFQAFLIEDAKISRISIANLNRNAHEISIIVALSAPSDSKNSQYWESLEPLLLFDTKSPVSAQAWIIEEACQTSRKLARLRALRAHQNANLGLGGNPAIELITRLIDESSRSASYQEILRAASGLASAIEFQECALLVDDNNDSAQILRMNPKSKREQVKIDPISIDTIRSLPFSKKGASLTTNGEPNHQLVRIAFASDCNSSIVMRFELNSIRGGKQPPRLAYLLLGRTDLVAFSEADRWLMEIAYGPIAISLEMIQALAHISRLGKGWQTTFDSISEPISVIDSKYKIQRANMAFASAAGAKVKSIIGRHCYTVLARRRRPCHGCPTKEVSSINQISARGNREFLASSYAVDGPKIRIQFYRDVSKETALTSALIQSEKMAGLGSLLAAIAHEINNPIAGILATSQFLKRSCREIIDSSEKFADIEQIEGAARRSKEIISNLIGFSSGYSNRSITLADAVAASVLFAKTALKHIDIVSTIPADIVIAPEHISSFQQILFNLLTNAAHAIDKKGTIRIEARQFENRIELSVTDSGKGIAKDFLSRIFEPFFTNKSAGKGTGLGLSIVKTLLSRMGGNITAESQVGKGSTFCFHFINKQTNEVEKRG
jgi:nitrogen-specific signal transduction histidine kinase